MIPPRQVLSYAILSLFLVFVFFSGIADSLKGYSVSTQSTWQPLNPYQNQDKSTNLTVPDVAHYVHVRQLSSKEFPLDDSSKRVIIVGDIHGMIDPFENLLKRVRYTPERDVLIHVGDIAAKAPLTSSLSVLRYMSSNNIIGVRGNHDQKIVEWRGWLKWASSVRGLTDWLRLLEEKWNEALQKEPDLELETWLKKKRKSSSRKERTWWRLIPEDWTLLDDHYMIAKDMSEADMRYLLKLPLRLYIPSAHAFIVHAGLLPSNPEFPRDDKAKQPLASMPALPLPQRPTATPADPAGNLIEYPDDLNSDSSPAKTIEHLRNLQEIAILTKIPQNKDPWVVLNMRSIIDGKVSKKSHQGTPWAEIWKQHMKHCTGFKNELDYGQNPNEGLEDQTLKLKCYPSIVVYGHAAARGLDVKRWSFGLDSGCVYGRKLSALVIRGGIQSSEHVPGNTIDVDSDDTASMKHSLPFGDHSTATVVSVKCNT